MSSDSWAGSSRHHLGDRAFAGTTRAAGLVILLALVGVVVFLTGEGLPALRAGALDLRGHTSLVGYLWPLVFGTLLAAALAMLIAAPLSIGVALAVSHFTPRPVGRAIGYVVGGTWPSSIPNASSWLQVRTGDGPETSPNTPSSFRSHSYVAPGEDFDASSVTP